MPSVQDRASSDSLPQAPSSTLDLVSRSGASVQSPYLSRCIQLRLAEHAQASTLRRPVQAWRSVLLGFGFERWGSRSGKNVFEQDCRLPSPQGGRRAEAVNLRRRASRAGTSAGFAWPLGQHLTAHAAQRTRCCRLLPRKGRGASARSEAVGGHSSDAAGDSSTVAAVGLALPGRRTTWSSRCSWALRKSKTCRPPPFQPGRAPGPGAPHGRGRCHPAEHPPSGSETGHRMDPQVTGRGTLSSLGQQAGRGVHRPRAGPW